MLISVYRVDSSSESSEESGGEDEDEAGSDEEEQEQSASGSKSGDEEVRSREARLQPKPCRNLRSRFCFWCMIALCTTIAGGEHR